MVKVRTSDNFEKVLNKIDNNVKIQLNKAILKIINSPEIGKHMKFERKGTREIYVGSFRLSYSYDKGIDTLYLLDLYHKDKQ